MCVGCVLEISCLVRRCPDDSFVSDATLSLGSRPVAVGHETNLNSAQSLRAPIVGIHLILP